MPRRLLRDRQIVADEWRYLDETAGDALGPLILTFDEWRSDRETWIGRGGCLGVMLSPDHKVEQLAADLAHWNFAGELRATGYVRRDQLFFLARCGFNSFELPDADIEAATSAFSTFTAAYQASNDLGLAHVLSRDAPAGAEAHPSGYVA
jgi:uncharacterized protein (DUF934 family)